MIEPIHIGKEARDILEKELKKQYPNLQMEYSPAFRHYYITDKKNKKKSENISAYELYNRLITEK